MALENIPETAQPVITDAQQPISLDTTQAPKTISLDTGSNGSYLLSPELITQRAFKTAYALSGTPSEKTKDEVQTSLERGQEAQLREQTAASINSQLANERYQAITELAAAKQGPLTPEDFKAVDIKTGYSFPYKYPRNSNSIFEVNYSKQYVSELDKFASTLPDTNFWNYGQMTARNDIEAAKIFGDVLTAQNQYLITKQQDAAQKIAAQTYVGFGLDFAKMAFPFLNPYVEAKMRSNVPGVGAFSGLLGENLEKQRLALSRLPFDQFTETVDRVYANLSKDNPQAASIWLQAMQGQSTSERLLNDVNTVGNMLDVPLIYSIGKTVYSRASLAASVQTAVKTALKASANPEMTKAEILASVGNIKGASVLGANEVLTKKILGSITPTEEAFNTLPVNFNIFKKDVEAADNLSVAQKNMLLEQIDGTTSRSLKTLAETLRPTRVELENINSDVLYKVQKTLTDRYPNDNVVRVDNPIREPLSSTSFSRMWWGTKAGEGFHDYHAAADAALEKGFPVTYAKPYLADIEARIASIKAEIKVGPSMHDDVGGLKYFDSLPDTLKTLETKLAEVSKPGGANIVQQGNSFWIERFEPYRETDKSIMELVASPKNPLAVSPDSWTKFVPYFNHLRNADETFSAEANANRKAAVFPQATFLAMVKEDGKIISDFLRGATRNDPITGELNPWYKRGIPLVRGVQNRKTLEQFNRVLDYSQNVAKDPETKITGYYFTPSELNDFYLRTFQRPASFAETQTYEAIKRWDETQRVFTQTMTYRAQARLGNQTQRISTMGVEGAAIKSPEFVGAIRPGFPKSRGTLLIVGDDLKGSTVVSLEKSSISKKDEWADLVKSGSHKMIELWDPKLKPFKDMGIKNGDTLIHYVLTPNLETTALRWDSIPRRGGGRFVYDYTHFIKQANMQFETVGGQRKSNYMGDTTVIPVGYKSMGEDLTRKMNVTRALIKEGKDVEAKAHFINNGLEGALEPWAEFRNKFNRFKDGEGVWHEPVYNIHEDFHVVPRNKRILDMPHTNLAERYGDKGELKFRNTWRDSTRENSPADNFQVQFTGERDAVDLKSVEDVGTVGNPIYKSTPAQKIDPLAMLNRGMRSTVNSLFMDDYKTYAVNSWLKEAQPFLKDGATPTKIWSSPFSTFKTITKDAFLSGTTPEQIGKLMANHFKIEQLVSTPTVLDSFVHSIAQNLADATYRNLGPTAASMVVPSWLIPKLKDPFAFFRSVTFNAYLGLFSVPQMLVQSMNYVNMFAISPRYAAIGTGGAYMHYLSMFNKNPEILEGLDRMISKLNVPGMPRYKPGEWLEAYREFEHTGFKHVGAEHASFDNMQRNNIIQNGRDRFLEWGRKPFQWGEQNSRIGAWYIAMKEFRDKNPTGALSNADRASILDRADMYQGNMSVASHSAVNSGILSLPTQFYMYTAHLGELFWSNHRLGGTLAERNLARARLFAVNAAMFGVPMAAGVTGLPVTEYLRKELLDNGWFGSTPPYVVGQNFVESLINEGVLAGGLAAATGKWYNVGPRLGLQGLQPMKELLTADASFWKIAGGASSSLTMNTFNNGIYPLMHQLFTPDGYKNVKLEDLVDVFKEAQTVSSGQAWWVAMNTGRWINKNSDYISDTSKENASFMFLTGLRETKQADIYNKTSTIQERDAGQQYALKQFALNMNRSLIAASNKDPDEAQAFRSKAIAWLPATDFPPEKLGTAIVRALKGAESLIDRIDYQYYYEKAPVKQRETLRKAFEYVRQNRGK